MVYTIWALSTLLAKHVMVSEKKECGLFTNPFKAHGVCELGSILLLYLCARVQWKESNSFPMKWRLCVSVTWSVVCYTEGTKIGFRS